MDNKHTIGQWKTTEVHNGYYSIGTGAVEYIDTKGQLKQGYRPIAFVGGNYCPVNEAEANAKLIAAAPILYNAAYSALQAIYAMPKSKQGFYRYLINDLLNAIQKANGTII